MREEHQVLEGITPTEEKPRPYVESPALSYYFQPQGLYDGKVFFTRVKVTYTFVFEKELVVLHFDRSKKSLFFKGHNLENMPFEASLEEHFLRFQKVMESKPETKKMLSAFNEALHIYQAKKV
ncbi:MAG: hypothetical protein A3G32_02180 [Deltaproteobacteria bacterium RIFCSPLOWO2_12_FULL_40_28]|nr:MAG: hypothetical protein A3C45_04485 [Deltaproteobacteria bacterium RIFCSPHIGHO2_02_FULL_40_28]OGQ21139.1 MAG: hypothetical protein A3E27_05245 [Deltaproteobacteria bacterium RIFCSPHIGHO2_12_FULL_40_32]OGQ39056.1 MAG: hypothetical protein A3I69_06910 [Deltaproteobacteria bacterium RIFCSPLOWO2_02_FULL_40_36]OGQ53103.1 MAG: hypothetical protein A3G32_02180 [Deltaproteobacteria bacterium RIFCSPLOWO2_12_FULL_40_28]